MVFYTLARMQKSQLEQPSVMTLYSAFSARIETLLVEVPNLLYFFRVGIEPTFIAFTVTLMFNGP